MSYFIIENEELVQVKTEILPVELEELYQDIRRKYIIQYNCVDWADDTGDSGMGYEYDNSYELFREPERREMVVQDGKLVGFYVGFSNDIQLEHKPTKEYFLKLGEKDHLYVGTSSVRYGNSKIWDLHVKSESSPLEYVCLLWVKEENEDHIFTPMDFDCKYIEAVCGKYKWEDSRGRFDGAFRVILKLTREGVENPDEILQAFQIYKPILIKE